jgi:hypothetical protein
MNTPRSSSELRILTILLVLICCPWLVVVHAAADETEGHTVSLARNKLEMTAPAEWTPKRPKFAGIVDYEFAVAAAGDDAQPARVTVGGAGGGIDANKRRWLAQFRQPDGARTEDRARVKQKTIADCTVHTLDVTGTYQAPPFDPGGGGPRKNYRLLAAVIDAGKLGSYYVKLYGPAPTIAANEAAFAGMIDSLRRNN